MADYSQILNVMKQAGASATDAKNPVTVCFGRVTSISPLKIQIEQKITLGMAQLVLTKRVVEDALQNGDSVVLLRVQGGQKYVVMDRVV